MKPLKIAVVGCGYMGKWHAQKLANIPDAELVAVVDEQITIASEVAAEYGAQPHTSMADIVNDVDAVTIATPTGTHMALAMLAIGAGLDVCLAAPEDVTVAARVHTAGETVPLIRLTAALFDGDHGVGLPEIAAQFDTLYMRHFST